jgi:uncharacterized protein (UPF0332 family)
VTDDQRRLAVLAEVARGDDAIEEAYLLLEAGKLAGAISRAYYGAFHYARALLITVGEEPRTHGGLTRLLQASFVRTGRIAPEVAALLSRLMTMRQDADYTAEYMFTPAMAREDVDAARTFTGATRLILAIHVAPDRSDDTQAPSTNGWLSYAYQGNPATSTTWNFINGDITVPPTPEGNPSSDFYFDGMQNTAPCILQPVLQWGSNTSGGGTYWTFAAYYVCGQNTVLRSNAINVSAGDVIGMQTYLNAVEGNPTTIGTIYQWAVLGWDERTNVETGFYVNIPYHIYDFNFGAPAVHESYGDNACEGGTLFGDIVMYANVGDPNNRDPANEVYVPNNMSPGYINSTSPSCFYKPTIKDAYPGSVIVF